MCLSTVYKIKGGEKEKVCEFISSVTSENGEYVFTDIMGTETRLRGLLRSVDLVKNTILIDEKE